MNKAAETNFKFRYKTFSIQDVVLKDNHFLLHYFEIYTRTFKVDSFQSYCDIQNSIRKYWLCTLSTIL